MVTRHEAPEIGAMVGRMLNALIRRAGEGDWEALEALALVEGQASAAMTAAMCEARAMYSLAELAQAVATSRQAVSQRTARTAHPHTPGCGHARCVAVKRCRDPRQPTLDLGVVVPTVKPRLTGPGQ